MAQSLFVTIGVALFVLPRALQANHGGHPEDYQEQLIVRSVNRGQVSAYFQFKTLVPTNLDVPYGVNAGKHNDIFPLSLLRLLHQQEVQELHLSLTKGMWKYDQWGLPPRDVSPNAHLFVWFSSYLNAQDNWKKVTSFLSGQFCASINLIKPTVTVRPKVSFRPFLQQVQLNLSNSQDYGYLAALPQEAICTENLTPWTKLLPCRSQKGLGSLLVATNVFNSQFVSLSLDFKFSCLDITHCSSTPAIELTQNILVVFNAPTVTDGRYSWTLNSLFNTPLANYCPISSSSHVFIESSHLASVSGSKLSMEPTGYVRFSTGNDNLDVSLVDKYTSLIPKSTAVYAEYNLKEMFDVLWKNETTRKAVVNLGIQYPNSYQGRLPSSAGFATVQARRHARGYGVYLGGITATLVNSLSSDIYAVYMDVIPWYFRMYLHTMVIEVRPLANLGTSSPHRINPTWLHYQPAQDRVQPHHLEMLLQLPAQSQIEIRFEFENQFLRWTEYPPDANHGLYISPATVTFFLPNQTSNFERFLPQLFESLHSSTGTLPINYDQTLRLLQQYYPLRLYTEPILISMPTPDFSMPYNVVCLVSTVMSIAFGPVYNLTTRRTTLIRKYYQLKKESDKEAEEKEEVNKPKKCTIM